MEKSKRIEWVDGTIYGCVETEEAKSMKGVWMDERVKKNACRLSCF